MNKTLYTLYTSILLAIMLAMGGCRASRKTVVPQAPQSAPEMQSVKPEQIFKDIAQSYDTWQDVYMPVTINLDSPKSLSLGGRATMVAGKEIYISLRIMGMEVAVLYVNESKIYAVDKFHKKYIEENLADLLQGVDIKISDVQNVLLGRITSFGSGTVTADDAGEFSYLSSDDKCVITPKHQFKGTELHYIATKSNPPMLTDISLRLSSKDALDACYSDIQRTPVGMIASVLTLIAPVAKTDMRASIQWNLNDAQWNKSKEVKFKAPGSNYKRIDAKALIESIGNM